MTDNQAKHLTLTSRSTVFLRLCEKVSPFAGGRQWMAVELERQPNDSPKHVKYEVSFYDNEGRIDAGSGWIHSLVISLEVHEGHTPAFIDYGVKLCRCYD